jgi:NADH dehydrogenase
MASGVSSAGPSRKNGLRVAQIVTVFGGTGFLGRRIVPHLHDKGFSVRIASRRPNPSSGDDLQLRSIAADIYEGPSIARALADAFGVVDAVSLYVERGTETFDRCTFQSRRTAR